MVEREVVDGRSDTIPWHTDEEDMDAMTDEVQHTDPTATEPTRELVILLYASDRTVRENVRFTLGRKVAADLPPVRVQEVATQPAVLTAMDRGGVDLAILDGEAVPGGMGLCRQLKDEIFPCPPILVLTARRDDAWLATWSRADGVVPHPVDPLRLPEAVAALLRSSTDVLRRSRLTCRSRVPARPTAPGRRSSGRWWPGGTCRTGPRPGRWNGS